MLKSVLDTQLFFCMMAVNCGICAGICDYYQLPLPCIITYECQELLDVMCQHLHGHISLAFELLQCVRRFKRTKVEICVLIHAADVRELRMCCLSCSYLWT